MLSIRAIAIVVALLVLGACKADTYTSADLASHEAFLKAAAVCEKIKNANEREACWAEAPVDWTDTDPDEITGVSLTGIDHLADHLSVQEFSVDGASAAQAGKGGSIVCCARLPNRWRPDLTVEVRWNVTNWRDCTGDDHVRRVPVERYELARHMYVHFLADGNVRVVSSSFYPESANRPNSRYPVKDPIPDKHPWAQYPFETTCKHKMSAKEHR